MSKNTHVSPKRMKKIDPLSYDLWIKYIKPYVKRSVVRTKEIRTLVEKGPSTEHGNPIIQNIIKDGRGMDGFQSAMMTWNYLAAICRYHESQLQKKR